MNDEGSIAIVHFPSSLDNLDLRVHPDNTNYFKVNWDSSSYPKASNSCASSACQTVYRGCLCDVNLVESAVFTSLPSANEIIENLSIGSFDPDLLGSYSRAPGTDSVKVWHKSGGYNKNTIFGITYRGSEIFLKNMRSTVEIAGATRFKFRNPPTFQNIGFREKRDAIYETDAVLKTYLFNDNVGPFLATRIIQRFGISNPSPRYVAAVATGMNAS